MIGLGNPGPDYAAHRHNIGHMVVDKLASDLGASFRTHKANAFVAEARVAPGGSKLILAKLGSFMNTSGKPTAALASFYKVDPAHIIVVHDELDIDFDDVRIKVGGGHAGHNGLRDISAALASPDFVRVRVGIGRPPGRGDAAGFVLQPFTKAEREVLPFVLDRGADIVRAIAQDGVLAAQQRFHAP